MVITVLKTIRKYATVVITVLKPIRKYTTVVITVLKTIGKYMTVVITVVVKCQSRELREEKNSCSTLYKIPANLDQQQRKATLRLGLGTRLQ